MQLALIVTGIVLATTLVTAAAGFLLNKLNKIDR